MYKPRSIYKGEQFECWKTSVTLHSPLEMKYHNLEHKFENAYDHVHSFINLRWQARFNWKVSKCWNKNKHYSANTWSMMQNICTIWMKGRTFSWFLLWMSSTNFSIILSSHGNRCVMRESVQKFLCWSSYSIDQRLFPVQLISVFPFSTMLWRLDVLFVQTVPKYVAKYLDEFPMRCCKHQSPYDFRTYHQFLCVSRTFVLCTSGDSESVEMGTIASCK